MDYTTLLTPTLHIEILLNSKQTPAVALEIRSQVTCGIRDRYVTVQVGQALPRVLAGSRHAPSVDSVTIVDYTGPSGQKDFHSIQDIHLDIHAYYLRTDRELNSRSRFPDLDSEESPQVRILPLPNTLFRDDWSSLIYDDALPTQLLRYLTRMLCIMKQPDLDVSTFNWNRTCLLHGPPGSGKSTLCRALAQKLSIRLSHTFERAVLADINANSLLSKYFGESGRLVSSLFKKVHTIAESANTLVCVMMDEIETVAGSREHVTAGGECSDGLRATNELLTALDHLRTMPNVIVLCTSNLTDAIDPAFLDRVDMKQLVPSPSAEAIYNIFRSCLNELVRAGLVDTAAADVSSMTAVGIADQPSSGESEPNPKRRAVPHSTHQADGSLLQGELSSPNNSRTASKPAVPTYAEMQIMYHDQPDSSARELWALAQRCEGFSGRTLRRLPILGLAMHTWGGHCSLQDAVKALSAAVDQELHEKQRRHTV